MFVCTCAYATRFHDFAITKNYAVFMHMPLVFDPSIMIKVRDQTGPGPGLRIMPPLSLTCMMSVAAVLGAASGPGD